MYWFLSDILIWYTFFKCWESKNLNILINMLSEMTPYLVVSVGKKFKISGLITSFVLYFAVIALCITVYIKVNYKIDLLCRGLFNFCNYM